MAALEEDIKQPRFKNVQQKLVINLLYTSSWMQNRIHIHLKPYGISPQQFNILRILRGQHPKPTRINTLIDRMIDKMSNASRLVEKLRQKGLVERTLCQKDRRAVDVIITEKGLELLSRLDQEELKWQEQIVSLSDTEAGILNDLLDKMRN